MKVLWIGVAGFAGAVTRYGVDSVIGARAGAFPWGIVAVNVSGSFLLGFTVAVLPDRLVTDSITRTALTVGFLGAYTTFSTFALDTMRLAEDGRLALAAANVLVSVVAALIAVVAGTWLGRSL